MLPVASYTVKDLSALAAVLEIPGRSGLKKAELYSEISKVLDDAHNLARAENLARDARNASDAFKRNPGQWSKAETETVGMGARLPRKLKKYLKKLYKI